MCFTTCGPVRHSKNAHGLSVTQRRPWICFEGSRPLALRDASSNSPEATAESLCPWPDTARRFVEINPHRPTHYSHPL